MYGTVLCFSYKNYTFIYLGQKKKSYLILRHFFQKVDAFGQLFIFTFIFMLGTFLDIWVCLDKQNSGGFTGSI